MTQTTFGQPVYLLDTCCPMDLDGITSVPTLTPPTLLFTTQEAALIWDGLEQLVKDGRLKLIKQVKDELREHHVRAYDRLTYYPQHQGPNMTNDLRRRYQALLTKYPKLIPRYATKDPADPWLIVTAQKFGMTIVTDEKHTSVRKSRPRTTPIPDVCQIEHVPCIDLRTLAHREVWLL